MDGLQSPQVRGAPERDHRPGEQVELHGEPDPEPGAVRGGVRGQKPVRQEEPAGIVAMSVNRSDARRTISRRKSADCAYVTPFERRREISLANPRAQGVLASSLEATAEVGPPAGAAGTHVPGTIAFSCFPT